MKDIALARCATAQQYLQDTQDNIDALKNFPPTMLYGMSLDELYKPLLALSNLALMSIERQIQKTADEFGLS